MPNEQSSQTPTGNPDGEPLVEPPTITLPQQGIITDTGKQDSDDVQSETKKKLHWLEIGYFSSQIVLAVIGIWALTIYHGQLTTMQGQLDEMKQTNELTQKAIDTANKANDLTMSLVKNEQQAVVDLTIPSDPDSLSQIAGGLSAQFVNKGKVDANNFSATATFQKVGLPSFEPIGKMKTVTIAQPRLLPLSGGHGGLESVAFATFDVGDLVEPDIASVKSETTTFKMVISYSYGDGFGDTINNTRCFLYLYVPPQPPNNQMWNSWDDCTMAMNVYRSYFQHKQK